MKRKGKAVKMKIASKLVVFFLMVSVVPLAIAGFIAYLRMSNMLHDMILYRLDTLARERVDRLELMYAERKGGIATLAPVPAVADALEDFTRAFVSSGLNGPMYRAAESRSAPLITALTKQHAFFDVILVSPAGDVVFTQKKERDLGTNLRTGPYKDTAFARAFALASAENRTVISDIGFYEPSQNAAVFMVAPVRKEDRFLGVIAIKAMTSTIYAVAGDYAGLGETGETSIVSAMGDETIWVAPTRHDPDAAFKRKLELGSMMANPAQEAAHGKRGTGAFPDYRGVPVLAAWRHIPSLGLGLVIKMDEAEALAPVRALTVLFVFLGLGALVVVFAVSMVIGRSLSRPILALTGTAGRMAGGDLNVRTDIRTGDEIGTLGAAFNDMAETLQRQAKSRERISRELETIIDSIPGLVFYKDVENRFIRVNKYIADSYKKTKKELEGASLYDLHSREEAQAYLDDDLKVIQSGKPKLNYDEGWPTETGFRWVNTSKIPYFDEKGEAIGIIGVSMDVTERRQAQEALDRKTRIATAINRVFRQALTCEAEEEVAKVTLGIAEELTGSKFGFIGEISAAGLMDTIAISNPGWEACEVIVSDAVHFIKNMPLRGIDRSTLREGRSRIVNADQITTHPDRVGVPRGHPPITCFLGVPIVREARTVGMIGLANKEGGYNKADQEAIEALAPMFYECLLRKRLETQVRKQSALQTGQNKLNKRMQGEKDIGTLADDIVACVAEQVGAQVGALFLAENGTLRLTGRYAYRKHEGVPEVFLLGEGLVGQTAASMQPIHLNDVPEDYVLVGSALGQAVPRNILAVPFFFNQEVKGVIEIASLEPFSNLHREFLDLVADSIGIAVQTAQSRERVKELLEASQRFIEELQTQQEELKTANEELVEQTQRLKESEERIKAQQEEMEVTNEELEEKNELLEQQKREVELARKAVEEKTVEVALASKYKSEFLANMSHELRTPLNSLLLLARGLAKNKEGNLTEDQMESARIIYVGGNDLLNLINEILDLSRIEAGRMDLRLGLVRISDLAAGVRASFGHMAKEKGIGLEVAVSDDAPAEITSDHKRVEQVIRNLLANAIKFTETGGVAVTFGIPAPGTDLSRSGLSATECLAVAIKDTGIGIAPEQHKIIFEAFHQVDRGTTRKYEGTGLGLSISREIVSLLGGEIQVESELGKGSVFTVYLPTKAERPRKPDLGTRTEDVKRSQVSVQPPIPDDRDGLTGSDAVILVIEDDPKFAGVLRAKCHEKGFKCLVAPTGEAGLELAAKRLPGAVILDIRLPGMDGWSVLSALKEDIRTRHIPVHVVSVESSSTESLRRGAVGHASKPVDQQCLEEVFHTLERVSTGTPKRLLVVEDDPKIRRDIVRLIGGGDVKVDEAGTGAEAMEALRSNRFNCVVLDLGLPDMAGNELLVKLERDGVEPPPVIVHTARDLTRDEEEGLREHAGSIVIKDVRSQERLLDEVSLFLHREVSRMPEKKRKIIRDLHDTDELLRGKKVLVVDDDMRTTFAVSRILSERGMKPLKAENGERALRLLEEHPDVALVLMDIMMPVMDGYEAMKRIRAREGFYKLPIIALTAKAMPEDREKCLAAGANDYMPKPVDEGRLISMIRVWMCR